MARHKNVDWHIPDEASIYDRALSVMMDIRDEIRDLRKELRKGGDLQEPELPAQFPESLHSHEPVRQPDPEPLEPSPPLPPARRFKAKPGPKTKRKKHK